MANIERPKFTTPEQEVEYLREQVARHEEEIRKRGKEVSQQEVISETLEKYAETEPSKVLAPEYALSEKEIDLISLGLSPDKDDETIMALLAVLQERGIRNALTVCSKMNSPHIMDDFHRALVQFIKRGFKAKGLRKGGPLWRVLNMTLYEIQLPEVVSQEEKSKPLKELISGMEQFYAGMLSISDKRTLGKYCVSIEIAVSDLSDEIIFYIAVPDHKKDLFEKHLLSIFPHAQIHEQKNDYNVFVDGGVAGLSFAKLKENETLPLKTYDQFDYDPLNIILNVFSKVEKEGGGASMQLIFSPVGNKYIKRYKRVLNKVRKGKKLKEATRGIVGHIFWGFSEALGELFGSSGNNKKDGEKPALESTDQSLVEQIQAKIASPIVDVNIRFVASAPTKERVNNILSELESGFNQFENTQGNRVIFKRPKGARLKRALNIFSFREYKKRHRLPLSLRELTTLVHFPPAGIRSSPQFKQSRANTAPAPLDLPQEGTLLGVNRFRNIETNVYITRQDRLRHFYVIGQTGTGKTVLMKNMIIQDMEQGEGVCMIDPHGNDIVDVLSAVPKDRYDDVIYFDPGYMPRVMGLNMLEYDERYPEQKTFVINEMFSIFQKLYGAVPESIGPMFEQYFRNATALVVEDPSSGSTLLDVSRVLSDTAFRELKISRSKNEVTNHFWEKIAHRAGGEQSLENIVPYIVSKFDVFLSNEIMRPVIGQQHSSFNFREVMDNKKILLVNLSKGRLGDINSNLIGLVIVGKILMAALSRADSVEDLPPFYLYIDEFQNITTSSIAVILSEARKYKLSLTIAHQFIGQLQDEIKNAVFGNVGSMAVFRIGSEDGEFLEKQFQPTFTASDLINIENWNAYLKLLVNGKPAKPFNIKTLSPPEGSKETLEELRRISYEKYGRPRDEVEEEIKAKYIRKERPKGDNDDDDEEEDDL